MDNKEEFENLLHTCKNIVERVVYYKIDNRADGDDILQEVYLTAYTKLDTLTDKSKFKSWIISIARNKIMDFYRKQAKVQEIPLEETLSYIPAFSRYGITIKETVMETIAQLNASDKQILNLYYFKNKSQAEIAARLQLPIGTIKSRLHHAKKSFIKNYPYPPKKRGSTKMKRLPEYMPEIEIVKSEKPAFFVNWEEMMGWFIVPKLGEKITWAMYDYPAKRKTECFDLTVIGKAMVHGIEGVEIEAKEFNTVTAEYKNENTIRTFVTQLTNTHCRSLMESHYENGTRHTYTFFDEDFLKNWGFGKDNCGNETHIEPKGIITKNGDNYNTNVNSTIDVVGRYEITINGKIYDTILVVDVDCYNSETLSEQYIDKNGKTVLWRRYNKNDWAYKQYQKLWSEKLPENATINLNGELYIHWYDCITDYII